ncbi:MAG: hypothetical protein V1676_05085 [Candidatus Diapherotrites archaeon]
MPAAKVSEKAAAKGSGKNAGQAAGKKAEEGAPKVFGDAAKLKRAAAAELLDLENMDDIEDEQVRRLLSPDSKMDVKIERGLGDLKGNYCVLAIVEPEEYGEMRIGLLRRFVNAEKMPGVYVCVNKSYEKTKEELEKRGIKWEGIDFIDVVTRMSEGVMLRERNVTYINSAAELTDLMLAIEKKMGAIQQNKKFLILDSVSTLLVYNSAEGVKKFTHSLIGKANQNRVKGVLIFVRSDEYSGILQTISQFCDKVVKIE